jgi:hypothetical protein
MDRVEMRARLRKDLKDEDPANYRWSDEELNRHIDHAVRELSLSSPLPAKATIATTPGSREISLSGLADLIEVEAVEYPQGLFPPNYVPFSLWGDTLTLLTPEVPQGEDVTIYYGKLHTLDDTSSTIPPHLEELVAIGAAAYAALQWANYAINRVTVGGEETWRHYLIWGQDRLSQFMRGLSKYSQKNVVRVRRLYKPFEPKPSQVTDWGP